MTNMNEHGHDFDREHSRSNKEFDGVNIYRIMTKATSDVGVPSTPLTGQSKCIYDNMYCTDRLAPMHSIRGCCLLYHFKIYPAVNN